ncbi:GNAT family N-acetyltransferase [Clostridium sp. YIM B02505]|uniref:GNAT family N-acetyltransferase n=1 Tax=Clostridium yunnanense TaxID=2800325 RepID=A0ABS1EV68_9CLOT|nr:GNAT family N-acetyltransferase [Clostridium yunnanense]MBK1813224.1 GNAT family N-acetyltransferase [Clostridium yunnanense]
MVKKIISTDNVIIRKAQRKDASEIILLVKHVMSEAPFFPRTPDEFDFTTEQEEEYIDNIALFLVAEIDGKIVGSATLDRSNLSMLSHTADFGITILKEFSGQGIGSLLLEKVIDWVELKKVEKINLEVFEDNLPAISLYKKFGFIEEGRRRKAIKAGEAYRDVILMGRFSNE